MADLEQRRQQYNAGLSRQQWEADPQGKLIEKLGPILEWLGQQHRAKDALTPEEQAVAQEVLTQAGLLASYAVPSVGIPANMAYEADRLSQEQAAGNEDASVAPLALAMLPMGALESRVGSLAGRGAKAMQGAERALGPAAVIGGPMVLAGTANAGEAGQDAAGQGQAGADPVRAQYQQQLEQLTAQIEAATRRRDEEAQSGYGPKAKAADEQLNSLMSQQRDITEKLRAYKSTEELGDLEGHRWDTLGMGAGLGAAAALPFIAGSYAMRRKGVSDFGKIADELGGLMKSTPEALPASQAGDRAYALVNEAYRAADTPAPFVNRGGGKFTPVSEIGGRRAAASRDSALFKDAPHMPGSLAIPAALTAEGAATTAYGMGGLEPLGMTPATPEEAQMYQTLGMGSLGMATGLKGASALGKAVLPKAGALERATVNQARNRLEREMAAGAGPSLFSRMLGILPKGSGGPRPPVGGVPATEQALPEQLPGSLSQPPSGKLLTQEAPSAASQTASGVSSDLPGSLAPEAGAKKARQPRPKKYPGGEWRVLGSYAKKPSRAKAKKPEGTK